MCSLASILKARNSMEVNKLTAGCPNLAGQSDLMRMRNSARFLHIPNRGAGRSKVPECTAFEIHCLKPEQGMGKELKHITY